MNIRWTTAALADLDNILFHAQERDALEARNLRARIERAERNIATFPKAAFHNQAKGYYERYIPRTRVILVYQIIEPDVIVIAAFHTSRSVSQKP